MKIKINISDIVQNDLCTGCGVCVSESPKALKMKYNEFGFLVPQQLEVHLINSALRVCPFNPSPDVEVQDEDKIANIFLSDTKNVDVKIGRFENTYIGYSNEYRESSSSGGIATFIFKRLLEEKIVDYLYIVKEIDGNYEYQLFNDVNDIIKISKTRYIPVTLENLFLEINKIEGKIAISGVACFIKAIRLKQYYHPELKEKIPFLVGIICGGLKSKFFTDYLVQKSGISSNYSKQEYRIKDAMSSAGDYSFGAFDDKQEFYQMKMRTVGDMWGTGLFKSNACDFCDDVTTELADISLGDAWLAPYNKDGLGTSVIVTRSKLAEKLIQTGIKDKYLDVEELNLETFKNSQKGSFNHRHSGLKFRIELRKKNKLIVPHNRKRFLNNIPLEFKIVQMKRMELRNLSLMIWKKNPDAVFFDESVTKNKSKLKSYTKYYHHIKKLKSIFKLKTSL